MGRCITRSLIFVSVLFLGCALGPDYTQPRVAVPDVYMVDRGYHRSVVNVPWWEVLKEPELQDLILLALERNYDLQIAMARVQEARALLGITRADQFPSLAISGDASKIEFDSEERDAESREDYTVGVGLSWDIDLWGEFRRATEARRAQLLASHYFRRGVALTLVSDVATTYFALLDFQEQLRISERTVKSRKESTRIIKARFDKGYVGELDYFQAKVEEEDAVAAVQILKRSARQAENALSVLLGRMPGKVTVGKSLKERAVLPAVPEGLPSELLERRPDVLQASAELHAQTARIGVAQAQRLPSISITGLFGVQSMDLSEFNYDDDKFWSFRSDILGPILSYNRNVNRVAAEEARTLQAACNYHKSVISAFRDVEDALIAVETFRLEYLARKRQAAAGRSASKLSRARYDAGQTNYLEVLDVERSLFRDELAESQALRNRFNSIVQLYAALGGGWKVQKGEDSPKKVQ